MSVALNAIIHRLGLAWAFRIHCLVVAGTGLPAAFLIQERVPYKPCGFVDWYVIPDFVTDAQLLTNYAQVSVPPQHVCPLLPRRRHRHLLHLCAALLHANLRRIHRSLQQHRRRIGRRVQRIFSRRPHCFWIHQRQGRIPQRPLHFPGLARHKHVRDLAFRKHSGRHNPLRPHLRVHRWGSRIYVPHRRRPSLRLSEHERDHGHDFDQLELRLHLCKFYHHIRTGILTNHLFQGSPVASYILKASGGADHGIGPYRPAMYFAGALALISTTLVACVRYLRQRELLAKTSNTT